MKEKEYTYNGQSKSEVPRDIQHLIIKDSSLEKIGDGLLFQCERLVTVELMEGLCIVGAFAFGRCSKLASISIPSTVEEISEDAFCYCISLRTVHLPEGGLKSIGKRAFQSCTSLIQVSIPSTVESIGHSAFRSCTSLKSVEMKEGLQMIGSHSFFRCKAVTNISLPSTVWKIGPHAFAKCQALVDVALQEGLKSIGQMAFHMCTSLYALSLPKSLESIGNAAFLDCSTLLGVEFPVGINVKMENHTFASCSALVNLFIPPSIEDAEGFAKSNNCSALEAIVGDQDIVKTLKGRFLNRRIHETCYYESQSTVDDVIAALATSTNNNEDEVVDGLGMTPFHIVATSASQRVDLLKILLDNYPLEVVSRKDRIGRTMIDYLLINRSPKAIPLIQMVLQRTLVDSMSSWGLDTWRSNLMSLVMESSVWEGHYGIRRRSLKRIHDACELFRLMERTSLLELAIWKKGMVSNYEVTESRNFDREGYRIVCGADVIIPSVLGFLRTCD